MAQEILKQDIQYLQGVGPKRAELLNKELDIHTYEDLLYHFPYRHIDRTKFYKISEIHPELPYIQLKGEVMGFSLAGNKYKPRLTAKFTDGTGTIDLVWFHGANYIQKNIKPGVEYVVFGKPSLFKRAINIIHPEMEEVKEHEKNLSNALQPMYSTTEKLKNNYVTSKTINKLQNALLPKVLEYVQESLPDYMLSSLKLLSLKDSLRQIHFPENVSLLRKAEYRLKFEELFYIQLNILKARTNRKTNIEGFIFSEVGKCFYDFYENNLPFELTNAQKRVLKEIRSDLKAGTQMNRLLQGDVGSGKTLVALMTMLISLDNGFQTCLMAPTEVLANQHYQSISNFLEGLDLNVKLLTGSTKKSSRNVIHEELNNGTLDILIGTHAVIEDVVTFKNLGLVIIDEQHRFGVAQRAKLWKKNTQPPHVLVMTATPIPRTLAMTLYGDLDVSVIDELPPGRKPVQTYHFYDSQRLRVFGFLKKQIYQGRQVFVVYPLIEESKKMDYKDLTDGYESLSRAFPPPDYLVSIVHGKMKPKEKDIAMEHFRSGKSQIMVATTVIEVGVDIANASVMVIESAERFGLSQLHQLRGRVGRGASQAYCILMTGNKLSNDAKKRLATMVKTNDGFEIAEADLKLRGPGDIEGTQQSGIPFSLKIANLGKDNELLMQARKIAARVLEHDPELTKNENAILKEQLHKAFSKKIDWSVIS
jgi:ATP-dependent DNA helicase RecG